MYSHGHEPLENIDFAEVAKGLQLLAKAYIHKQERLGGVYPLTDFHRDVNNPNQVYFSFNICIAVNELEEMATHIPEIIGFFNITSDVLKDIEGNGVKSVGTYKGFIKFVQEYYDEEMQHEKRGDSNP